MIELAFPHRRAEGGAAEGATTAMEYGEQSNVAFENTFIVGPEGCARPPRPGPAPAPARAARACPPPCAARAPRPSPREGPRIPLSPPPRISRGLPKGGSRGGGGGGGGGQGGASPWAVGSCNRGDRGPVRVRVARAEDGGACRG